MSSKKPVRRYGNILRNHQVEQPERHGVSIQKHSPLLSRAAHIPGRVPRLLMPGDLLYLQRTLGNQAVNRLLGQRYHQVQRKSEVPTIQRVFYWNSSKERRPLSEREVLDISKRVYGDKLPEKLKTHITKLAMKKDIYYIRALQKELIRLRRSEDRDIEKSRRIIRFMLGMARHGRGNVSADVAKSKGESVRAGGKTFRRMRYSKKKPAFDKDTAAYSIASTAGVFQEQGTVCDLSAGSFAFLAAKKGLKNIKFVHEGQKVKHCFNMIQPGSDSFKRPFFADGWVNQAGFPHHMKELGSGFYKGVENPKGKKGYNIYDADFTPKQLGIDPFNSEQTSDYLAPWSKVPKKEKSTLEERVKERVKDPEAHGLYDQSEVTGWGHKEEEFDNISDFEGEDDFMNEDALKQDTGSMEYDYSEIFEKKPEESQQNYINAINFMSNPLTLQGTTIQLQVDRWTPEDGNCGIHALNIIDQQNRFPSRQALITHLETLDVEDAQQAIQAIGGDNMNRWLSDQEVADIGRLLNLNLAVVRIHNGLWVTMQGDPTSAAFVIGGVPTSIGGAVNHWVVLRRI